jgi:Uma2 family endonuclease
MRLPRGSGVLPVGSVCEKNTPVEAALRHQLVEVDDYLEGEMANEIRHEFVAGQIFAMAGASEEHNILVGNLFAALHGVLRGKGCRVFTLDMKVRVNVSGATIFYYPDLLVTCDRRDLDRYFKIFPRLLVEVMSPETERTDRREKFVSYTRIESLDEYVLIAQDSCEVTVFRRARRWQPELISQADQQLELRSVEFKIPLNELYRGVL